MEKIFCDIGKDIDFKQLIVARGWDVKEIQQYKKEFLDSEKFKRTHADQITDEGLATEIRKHFVNFIEKKIREKQKQNNTNNGSKRKGGIEFSGDYSKGW